MFSDVSQQQTALQSAQKALAGDISDGELAALSKSTEAKVRAAVAAHAGTPLMTLLRLAADASVDVRIGVASNPRVGMPVEVFEDLAKDKNVDVVYALISNPAVPDSLIGKLGRQLHKEYSKPARARLAAAKKGLEVLPINPSHAEVLPHAEAFPEVPAFPAVQLPAVTPILEQVAQDKRARNDALDALLGGR